MSRMYFMEDNVKQDTLPKRGVNQSIIDYCKVHYGKGHKRIDREVDRLKGKKRCTMCGKLKPNNLKYFHKNSQTKDGLHYNCKKCRNNAKRDYYAEKLKSSGVQNTSDN